MKEIIDGFKSSIRYDYLIPKNFKNRKKPTQKKFDFVLLAVFDDNQTIQVLRTNPKNNRLELINLNVRLSSVVYTF